MHLLPVPANNRGLFKSKFYVINHTTAPAILIEIGFISNADERSQLTGEKRKQATAQSIADGIQKYLQQYK
jgi:N-acetylmuramoyl-L-alanine amidase